MGRHKKPKITSVFYKGDFYYASGNLTNLSVDYDKMELCGELKVKLTGELIKTLFLFGSKHIIVTWDQKEKD